MDSAQNSYSMIPPAVVRCINSGKVPSLQDLQSVADRIGADLKTCGQTGLSSAPQRGFSSSALYRAAEAALIGVPDGAFAR